MGNTVLVVEHDEDAIRTADHVIDMGPGAGVHGGHIIAEGTPADIMRQQEKPDRQISHRRWKIFRFPPQRRKAVHNRWLKVVGAQAATISRTSRRRFRWAR